MLAAVLAFMIGVIITALLMRKWGRDTEMKNREAKENDPEKEGEK